MYKTLVFCKDGSEERDLIFQLATDKNIQTEIVDEHTVRITSDNIEIHDTFIDDLSDKNKYTIMYNEAHSKCKTKVYKNYYKCCKSKSSVNTNIHSANNIAKYYNFPTGSPKINIAIISLGGSYKLSDLHHYWKNICGYSTYPKVINVPIEQDSIPHFDPNDDSNSENTLDLEIVGGICPSATLIFYSAPNTTQGFYSAVSAAINNTKYPSKVISISWGGPENEFDEATTLNTLLATAVAKGIPVCVASGDNGSGDGEVGSLNVDFPSSSPNVVSCGGTSIPDSGNETAWIWNEENKWGGGGGISTLFPKPFYQSGVETIPETTFRMVPDVSLLADPLTGWIVYYNGEETTVGGTSCAAPAFAGYLGLIDITIPKNKCINELLYQIYTTPSKAACYKDIIGGSNDSIPNDPNYYNCIVGYDMVTGMGSIDGTNLFNKLQSLI